MRQVLKDWQAVDDRVVLALRTAGDASDPIGPRWFEEMVRDVSALGSPIVLAAVIAIAVGYLALLRKGRSALFITFVAIGGQAGSLALKALFGRARPELVPHGTAVYSRSFPSGHSMMAAIVFLALALAITELTPDRRLRVFSFVAAALLTVAVGFSRVYLGVHWPTDVLGGWLAGTGWCLSCWAARSWLARGRPGA